MCLPATILHAAVCTREHEQQQRAEAAENREQRLKQGTVFAAVLECSNLYSLLLIVAIGIAHAMLATQCTRLAPQCCAFVCWYVRIVTHPDPPTILYQARGKGIGQYWYTVSVPVPGFGHVQADHRMLL